MLITMAVCFLLVGTKTLLGGDLDTQPHGPACPKECLCIEGEAIICTCDGGQSSSSRRTTLTLNALAAVFGYIEAKRLVIHSCDKVVFEREAFKDVRLSDMLKIESVLDVEIHPHAFSGISKSPRQFTIQNSRVKKLAAHAFTGLEGIEYFFLRDLMMGRIERFAFAGIAHIGYLYFRNATIARIDTGAFALMNVVHHMYLRGHIHINAMGDHLFIGSTLGELIVEDAILHSGEFPFVGVDLHRFRLLHSQWHSEERVRGKRERRKRMLPPQSVHEFHVENCSLSRFIPSLLYNYTSVLVDSSRIGSVQAIRGPKSKRFPYSEYSTGNMHFYRSHIDHWHPRAIYKARGGRTLVLEACHIFAVHHRAVAESEFAELYILNTTVKTLAPSAFPNNILTHVHFNDSNISWLGSGVLNSTLIYGQLLISSVEIRMSEDRAFAFIQVWERMQIENSIFYDQLRYPFAGAKIEEMVLRRTTFYSPLKANLFDGLVANRFRMEECSYSCAKSDCELNSLLLQPSVHTNLAWSFTNNHCISKRISHAVVGQVVGRPRKKRGRLKSTTRKRKDKSLAPDEVCSEEHETTYQLSPSGGELICRRRLIIEECVCSENEGSGGGTSVPHPPLSSARILLLGDCAKVVIAMPETKSQVEKNPPAPAYLYLYRVAWVEVAKLLPSVDEFHLLHSSHISIDGSPFAPKPLRELTISGSVVHSLGPSTFHGAAITRLIINNSEFLDMVPGAFDNSCVDSLRLTNSRLYSPHILSSLTARRVEVENCQLPYSFLGDFAPSPCGTVEIPHREIRMESSSSRQCTNNMDNDMSEYPADRHEIRIDGECWRYRPSILVQGNQELTLQEKDYAARRVPSVMIQLCLILVVRFGVLFNMPGLYGGGLF